MLSEIEQFVNWLRRRNPQARTWRGYSYDLKQPRPGGWGKATRLLLLESEVNRF